MNLRKVISFFLILFLFPVFTVQAFSLQDVYSDLIGSVRDVGGVLKTTYVNNASQALAQAYNPVNDTILSIWCGIKKKDIACDPDFYVVQVGTTNLTTNSTTTNTNTSSAIVNNNSDTAKIIERVIERYAPASVINSGDILSTQDVINLIAQYAPVSVITERIGSIQGSKNYDSDISSLRSGISSLETSVANIDTSQWISTSTVIYYDGGRVGIGTSTPEGALGVVGDIHFTGNLYQNGVAFSGGGSGLTSLNAQSDSVQFFATSSAGTDLGIVSSGGTHTFSIPTASSTTARGLLSSADWTTFNNKVSASRAINTSGPLSGGGDLSSDRTISISQAGAGTDGYLSSSDWVTFNSKVSSQWTTNSSNIYYTTGSVGIGTTTPAFSLDVYGSLRISTSSTPALSVDPSFGTGLNRVGINTGSGIHALTVVTSASSDGITIRRNNTATSEEARLNFRVSTSEGSATAYVSGVRVNTPSAGDMAIVFANQKSSSLSESMRIDSNGNVGIGTSSPLATLAITTNSGATDALRIASSTNARLFTVGQSGDVFIPNGKLGIGQSTASYALDTSGDINLSGSLYWGGSRVASFRGGNWPHIVMGVGAGYGALDNGDQINTIIGGRAGAASDSSTEGVTIIGGDAGYGSSAALSTFVGYRAGYTNTTGSSNTIIGSNADVSSGTLTNATAIGAGAVVSASNSLVLGGSGVKVGIGSSTPQSVLSVTTQASIRGFTIASSTNGLPIFSIDADERLFTRMQANKVCVGYGNTCSGAAAVNIGHTNTSSGSQSVAVGHSNSASGIGGYAFGRSNTASAQFSIAMGEGNTSNRNNAIAIGQSNSATSINAILVGLSNTAGGDNSLQSSLFGYQNTVSALGTVALGYQNTVSASGSSAVGHNINNSIASSFQWGPSNTAKAIILSSGNMGIGTTDPQQKLHVYRGTDGPPIRIEDTNGYCEIDPTSTSWTCTSDERLKKNIVELSKSSSLENLKKLQAVTFAWKTQSDNKKRFGFIAQQVEPIFPELVSTDENGFKSVAYGGFTPFIIGAIQELDNKITNLEKLIASSTAQVGHSSNIFVDFVQAMVGKFTKVQIEDGIEIRDRVTNKIYCTTIMNGDWVKIEGQCSNTAFDNVINIAPTVSEVATTTESVVEDTPVENASTTESVIEDTPVENASTTESVIEDTPVENASTTESVIEEKTVVDEVENEIE